MVRTRANSRSKEEWFQLIQECRSSGLTDRTWCEQHGIMVSSFYNAVKRLRKNAYDIPYVSNHKTYALDITCANKQEAVRIDICPEPFPEAVPSECRASNYNSQRLRSRVKIKSPFTKYIFESVL